MTTTTTSNPPTPRRCQRIMEAHHLRCQGLSLQEIADRLGCARSTVHAYLRDFQLHRAHILETVAADRLADQVYLLTQPETEPAQHRQHVATARELRLLLTALPQLEARDEQRREQAETARNAEAVALARSRHFMADPDGHLRYHVGDCECMPECPMCHPQLYEGDDALPPFVDPFRPTANRPAPDSFGDPLGSDPDLNQPEPSQPEPYPSPQFPEESSQTRTNLNKSEHQEDQHPAPDRTSARPRRNSRPPQPRRTQYPVRRDDPFGDASIGQLIKSVSYSP